MRAMSWYCPACVAGVPFEGPYGWLHFAYDPTCPTPKKATNPGANSGGTDVRSTTLAENGVLPATQRTPGELADTLLRGADMAHLTSTVNRAAT